MALLTVAQFVIPPSAPFLFIGFYKSWHTAGLFVLAYEIFCLPAMVVFHYLLFLRIEYSTKNLLNNLVDQTDSRQTDHLKVPTITLTHGPGLDELEPEAFSELGTRESQLIYSSLRETDIRILKVLPAEDEMDPLKLVLVHLPLLAARASSYTALSYTWGNEINTGEVFLNGRYVRIRPNLEQILRTMRSLQYESLWVDALCINQSDSEECSAQVLRMRGIYAGARSVIASIDISLEESKSIVYLTNLVDPEISPAMQRDKIREACRNPTILSAIQTFCEKSYWNRIWIVQEFAIPRSLSILLNTSVVKAEAIERVLSLLSSQPGAQICKRVSSVFDIRKAWQTGQGIPLLSLLFQTKGSLCGKRHDRVFGLLGLALDQMDFLSEPDYNANLYDLSISMTKSYMERRKLDVMLITPHGGEGSTLPSWCPDWFGFDRQAPDGRISHQLMQRHSRDLFSRNPFFRNPFSTCSNGWYATGSTHAALRFSGVALTTSARYLGTIYSLGWCLSDSNEREFPRHDQAWVERCRHVDIVNSMHQAILSGVFKYNKPLPVYPKRLAGSVRRIEAYSWVWVFLERLGRFDYESQMSDFARWIGANRRFSIGGRCLQDHAKRLQHPLIYFNLALIGYPMIETIFSQAKSATTWLAKLESMSSKNMRLMCLNDDAFGIGWASPRARLYDEVFLIPGCSMPVILRPQESRQRTYRLVGDAIVIGAMQNEIWGQTRPTDLSEIEII